MFPLPLVRIYLLSFRTLCTSACSANACVEQTRPVDVHTVRRYHVQRSGTKVAACANERFVRERPDRTLRSCAIIAGRKIEREVRALHPRASAPEIICTVRSCMKIALWRNVRVLRTTFISNSPTQSTFGHVVPEILSKSTFHCTFEKYFLDIENRNDICVYNCDICHFLLHCNNRYSFDNNYYYSKVTIIN